MQMFGRLVSQAEVKKLKDDRQVISFIIALNDTFRSNGETKKRVTYVDCSYWRSLGVAPYLSKGAMVEIAGNIGVNAYLNKEGIAKARITFHVNDLKLHGSKKDDEPASENPSELTKPLEDLPF
ncbi:MAG: single-stranded DNA-binding protein [Chitinophagaceae bacterium]|nr:single-stranded DNA-binding protein [Chitinophagaceae bacterium]